MTNEEAIIILGNIPIKPEYLDDDYSIPEYQEAKALAIQALKDVYTDTETELDKKLKEIDKEIKRCKHDAEYCRHGDIGFEPDFKAAKVWDNLVEWLTDYKRLLKIRNLE